MWHLGTRWTWQCWVNLGSLHSVTVSVPVEICQRCQASSDLCRASISWKPKSKTIIATGVDFLWLLILPDSFRTWCCLNISAPLPILNWQFLTFFNPLGLILFTVHLNLMASGNHGQSCLTLFRVFVMCKDSLSPTVTSLPIPKAPQKDHEFWLQSELLIVASLEKHKVPPTNLACTDLCLFF